MYRILLTLLLTALTVALAAQPKWVKKARKAQLNFVTYDAKTKRFS